MTSPIKKPDLRINIRWIIWNEAQDGILLVKHAENGKWVLPWGHLDPGENFEECLVREIEEEMGLIITIYGDKNYTHDEEVTPLNTPFDIHEVQYIDTNGGPRHKLVIVYRWEIIGKWAKPSHDFEIYDTWFFSHDEVMSFSQDEIHEKTRQLIKRQNNKLS